MKKLLAVLLVVSFMFIFTGCSDGGKCLNVEIMETYDAEVRFRPVCPECGNVGDSRITILYPGEGDVFSDVHACEECFYIFEIGITRD